jgi:plastocyanin
MFASPVHDYKPKHTVRFKRVAFPFLRYLNTSALAFALVVALALLTSIRGREPETKATLSKNAKAEVVIDHFTFSPKTVTLPVGATVIWRNQDNVPHVIVSADDQFKKSPLLNFGQRFSSTFATTGTYSYFCSIHPRMRGTIIVK